MRCDNMRGTIQCDRERGHAGDCEHQMPEYLRLGSPVDRDAPCELKKAASQIVNLEAAVLERDQRIARLEAALRDIKQAPCDAAGTSSSCMCCLHDRAIASEALGS